DCIRVPMSALESMGSTELSAELAVAPITMVRVLRSSMLRAGAVCQIQVTCGCLDVLDDDLLKALAARDHQRPTTVEDEIDATRAEIGRRRGDLRQRRLEMFLAPVVDVAG